MTYQQERKRREFAIEQAGKEPIFSSDRKVSPEELAKHARDGDCWIALHGLVLDVSDWVGKHPGGRQVIQNIGGKSGTKPFDMIHGSRGNLLMIAEEYSQSVKIVGEYDDPNAEELILKDTYTKEHVDQSERNHTFIVKGAMDFEEEIQIGKAEVVKVTQTGPMATLFISGQTATETNLKRPMKEQSDSAVNAMREELEKAGATLEDIVKINAYIVDIDEQKVASLARALTAACAAWGRPYDLLKASAKKYRFNPDTDKGAPPGPPAFTWVGATGLAVEKALVEIEAVAVLPGKVSKL